MRGTTSGTWPTIMDKGFVGGTQDPTGLTHLGAREYDPSLGRFVSDDPVTDTNNPQQINGYSYANNTPTAASDPDGLKPCLDGDDCAKATYGSYNWRHPHYVPGRYVKTRSTTVNHTNDENSSTVITTTTTIVREYDEKGNLLDVNVETQSVGRVTIFNQPSACSTGTYVAASAAVIAGGVGAILAGIATPFTGVAAVGVGVGVVAAAGGAYELGECIGAQATPAVTWMSVNG